MSDDHYPRVSFDDGAATYADNNSNNDFVEEHDDDGDIDVENFDSLLRSVKAQRQRDAPPQVRSDLKKLPEVADDYVRNYLVARNLLRTLDTFETEWYEIYGSTGDNSAAAVPEVYVELSQAQDESQLLRVELEKLSAQNKKLTTLFENAKRERDFHRANHGRVVQEKDKLLKDVKGLQSHASTIDPTMSELRSKYEASQKDKMLLKLERDKLLTRVGTLEDQVKELEGGINSGVGSPVGALKSAAAAAGGSMGFGTRGGLAASTVSTRGKAAAAAAMLNGTQNKNGNSTTLGSTSAAAAGTTASATGAAGGFVWPADGRNANTSLIPSAKAPSNAAGWSCRASFKAHSLAVTHLALHPRKPIAASCSDDGTWRLSSLPQGELVMSGQGHRDWIAGIAMHPKATMVATASGDKTVKLWDFASNDCRHTLKAHAEGVWCVEFHDTGDMLASGGLDHSIRVWDTELGKCRQSLRGHVDAVNSLAWIWGTNTLVSGSGDKTVSLWDARANYCVQTFYGHHSAVSGVSVPPSGDVIASCDTEGQVIVWDVRMLEPRVTFSCGPHPTNSVSFDRSGSLIAAASDDHTIRMLSVADGKQSVLRGHEDAVQHAVFDPQTNGFLVSCGSDATVRYWS